MAALALLTLLAAAPAHLAAAAAGEEYEVKAAILLNLAKFVNWPPSRVPDPHAPLVVGILAPADVAATVEKAVADKSAGAQAIAVRRLNSPAGAAECHLVFIARTAKRPSQEELAEMARLGVLTVGEQEGFAAGGGVVGLVVKNQRVGMEINMKAAQSGRLKISARVLALATIVDGE
jgi:hypothetical protein